MSDRHAEKVRAAKQRVIDELAKFRDDTSDERLKHLQTAIDHWHGEVGALERHQPGRIRQTEPQLAGRWRLIRQLQWGRPQIKPHELPKFSQPFWDSCNGPAISSGPYCSWDLGRGWGARSKWETNLGSTMDTMRSAEAAGTGQLKFISKRVNRTFVTGQASVLWPIVSAEQYAHDRIAMEWRDDCPLGGILSVGA